MSESVTTVANTRLAGGVLVINLDHRPERLVRFESMARTIGFLQGWERIPAANGVELPGYGKPPWFRGGKRDKAWAGRAGCILSHRKAIEFARAKGWESVLILEDDIEFADGFEQVSDDLGGWLMGQSSCWHACYLGFTQIAGPCRKVNDMSSNHILYEVSGCSTTHAYLLRSEAFGWILKHLPDETSIWTWVARHRAIDRWYARSLAPRHIVLAVSPGIVGQYSDFSDIAQLDPGPSRRQEFLMAVDEKKSMKSAIGFHILRRLRTFVFDWFRLTDLIPVDSNAGRDSEWSRKRSLPVHVTIMNCLSPPCRTLRARPELCGTGRFRVLRDGRGRRRGHEKGLGAGYPFLR